MSGINLRKPICLLVASALALLLSGCIKAQMTIIVEPDGSGTFGIAIGMTQLAVSLAGTDGESLMQRLSQEMSTQNEGGGNVVVRRWTEGEYEWIETTRHFASLDEMNSLVGDIELFERFSLTRRRGLFRDQFVLDALLAPLLENQERPEDLIIDPSGMFEFRVSVRLPGDVTQTNGIFAGDSNTMLWIVNNYEPLEMHAVSEVWNWFNIGVLSAIGIGSIVVVIVVGAVFYRVAGKRGPKSVAPSTRPSVPKHTPGSNHKPAGTKRVTGIAGTSSTLPSKSSPDLTVSLDILSQINAYGFLEQVNKHVLGGTGTITEMPNGICIAWPAVPGSSRKREIRIEVLDRHTLMVNGMHVPATQDGIKQGLVAALKELL